MKLFKGQIEWQQDYSIKSYYNNFFVYDSKGNLIYYEDNDDYWFKREFDNKGNKIYYENSESYWNKSEYDSNNNLIYYESSNDFWFKREFDSNDNEIYYENSEGTIEDNRPKKKVTIELTEDQLEQIKKANII